MAVIPPWIKAADPAAHMEAGMRIGVQIGAQQAEERFRQQQLAARAAAQQEQMDIAQAQMRFRETQAARQQQMQAQQQALAEQKLGMVASETARKHQAMQEYQNALAGGMNETDAILKFGPSMAANAPVSAALRVKALANKPIPSPQEITLPSGLRGVQVGNTFKYAPNTPRPQTIPEGSQFIAETPDIPAHWQTPPRAGAVKSVPAGAKFVPEAGGTPGHWEIPAHTGTPAKIPADATFVPASGTTPAHWQLAEKPETIMTESERSARLRELRDERKDIMENQFGSIAVMKKARGKTLNTSEQNAIDALEALDREQKQLLPPIERKATIPKSAAKKTKVELAKEIDRLHPEWTREQVIKAANDAFTQQQ